MRKITVAIGMGLLALVCVALVSRAASAVTLNQVAAQGPAVAHAASLENPQATTTPCTITFSDVHTTDYFYSDVRCVYCLGAISGYSDGTFRPFSNTTRGQLTKIIVIALRIQLVTPPATPTFSDVPNSNPFYVYVETAARNNIVSGYSDGSFRPNLPVTRGQLSKIVVTAANHAYGWPVLHPNVTTFSDVRLDSTYFPYIETAVCRSIISGYSDGTFRPGNFATRAQIAKIVCKTSQNPANICTNTQPGVAPPNK